MAFDFSPDIRCSLMNLSELQFFDVAQHFGLAVDANSDKEARYMALRNAWAVVDAKGLGFDSLRKVILAVVRGENHWLIPTPGSAVAGGTTTESIPLGSEPGANTGQPPQTPTSKAGPDGKAETSDSLSTCDIPPVCLIKQYDVQMKTFSTQLRKLTKGVGDIQKSLRTLPCVSK